MTGLTPVFKTRTADKSPRGSGGLLFLLALFLLRRLRLGRDLATLGGRCVRRLLRGRALARGPAVVALTLLDASCLARQVAQIVEPRLVDATARDHLDLVDVRRVVGEDPLDAHAVGDLAHREGRARTL